MSVPSFSDLGKSARDVFRSGYHYGKSLIKLTGRKTGGSFEIGSDVALDCDAIKLTGTADSEYKTEYGNFLHKWTMDGTVVVGYFLNRTPIADVGLRSEISYNPGTAAKVIKIGANCNKQNLNAICSISSDMNSNVDILGSIVTAFKGFTVGYQGGYSAETNKMTKNDVGMAFSYQDVGFHLRCTSIPNEFGLSLQYKDAYLLKDVYQFLVKPAEPATMAAIHANFSEQVTVICKRSVQEDGGEISALEDVGLWTVEPNFHSIIVYSVLIPILSALGIVGNALILCVLGEGNFKASVFTYLTVLAGADLVTCIMILFSGLARGVFWCRTGWLEFDVFVHLPVASVSSNLTVWATILATIDRLAIVFSLSRCKPPKFCNHHLARKLMVFSGCFAILFNVPYCLIYTLNEQGDLITTRFFHSWLYDLQNWLQFVMFGAIPAVLLLVANLIMCHSVKETLRQRKSLLRGNLREGNRLTDQARMTVMLVGITFVFIVGEVPTHLASRRSALTLLHGGDLTKVQEYYVERFRMYATLLNAISGSANFVLYCLLNRHFLSHLKRLFNAKTARTSATNVKTGIPYSIRRI
ncbi:uncharacterized protein LOC143349398 [Colletes latitarsis]|uniref:uncharacterized protein LOC143349398 n=1 Tax=Colletes latitarsis TaxID=2605962 RepID=UPI0040356485